MNKPVPSKKGISELYWNSLQEEIFLIQRCDACRKQIFYPRILCPYCGSKHVNYIEHSGIGDIYSYSIIHKTSHSAFKKEVPYVIALVNLQGGGRMMARIIDVDIEEVKMGAKVKVVFKKLDDETTLPYFGISK